MNPNPDADREPRDTDAPLAIGGAASDLEGAVGTKNRGRAGTDPDDKVGPNASDNSRSGQNPPAERSQRNEEGGDQLSASQSSAAFKSGTLHDDGLAGQVEASTDDEMPSTDSRPGPQNIGTDARIPDELARPAGEIGASAYKRDTAEGDGEAKGDGKA